MTASRSIERNPSLGYITGKWVLFAGLVGFAIQLAWCLNENLSDEQYYTRNYVTAEAERLTGSATFRKGQFEIDPSPASWPYQGKHAAAYGFRILDVSARVLAHSNGKMVEATSSLAQSSSGWPDFWQHKIGPRSFEIAGGVRRQVDGQDVWIEVVTLGDPQFLRLNALKAEILKDVWTPLAPTLFLTTLLAIVAVRNALGPLRKAADQARALDARQEFDSIRHDWSAARSGRFHGRHQSADRVPGLIDASAGRLYCPRCARAEIAARHCPARAEQNF